MKLSFDLREGSVTYIWNTTINSNTPRSEWSSPPDYPCDLSSLLTSKAIGRTKPDTFRRDWITHFYFTILTIRLDTICVNFNGVITYVIPVEIYTGVPNYIIVQIRP